MKLLANGLLLAATAASLAGGVLLIIRHSDAGGMEIVLPTPGGQPATATGGQSGEIKVYVTGGVAAPGVYAVEAGSRLEDVIEAAGGLTGDADPEAVNLAVRVKDEQRWHVPRVGESAAAAPAAGRSASGKIDLNSASARDLEELPGIGAVKAQSIVAYREANGPFSRIEDLLGVRGIGPATIESIQDLIDVR